MCCLTHVFFLALLVLAHGGHYLNSEDEEREEKIPERAKPVAGARWAKRKYSDWEEEWHTYQENSVEVLKRWPWVVVITLGPIGLGIGTLVKPNWILSSARCVSTPESDIFPPPYNAPHNFPHYAVFGVTAKNRWDGSYVATTVYNLTGYPFGFKDKLVMNHKYSVLPANLTWMLISRKIVHPEYAKGIKQHDIALLKLIDPIELAANVQLVKFAQELPEPDMECKVPAFGSCKKGIITDEFFMEHRVIIANQSLCQDMLRKDRFDDVADVPIGAVFDSILYEKYLEELSLLKFCTKPFMWKAFWEPSKADFGGPMICNGRMYGLATSAFHYPDLEHVFYLVTGTAEQLLWINRVFIFYDEKPIINRLLKIENHASHRKTLGYLIGTIGFLTLAHVLNINNHL